MILKYSLLTMLACACLTMTGCQDETDTLVLPEENDKTVNVDMQFGIAEAKDGYGQGKAVQAATSSCGANGFQAELMPGTCNRATGLKPQKLYNLTVVQFDRNGKQLTHQNKGDVNPGETIGLSFSATAQDDCQLLFIATGSGNGTIATKSTLKDYQALMATNITTMGTDENNQTEVDKQPYVLFLPHVRVTGNTIQSPDPGSDIQGNDVRILLKRLAAKLAVEWTFDVPGYDLTELRLSQVSGTIPTDSPNKANGKFFYYPETETTKWTSASYPTQEKEFVDYFRLRTDAELKAGTYTTWLPANIKGTAPLATTPQYRSKENAPEGASYLEFIAERKENNQISDRLYYRVYLGGRATTDFNICENTNYTWKVSIKSSDVSDPRVTRLDMTPVSSNNYVNTSNCFMIRPGTDICFNPYRHEAGTVCGSDKWNYQLVDVSSSSPLIKSGSSIDKVKVLWQSRNNGTSGELVMGYYISKEQQENLVSITEPGDVNKARVHIKVPVTQGGNAVIAAYNGNTILWSWHLWITDYVPERMKTAGASVDDRYKAAQSGTQYGTVHKYRSAIFKDGGAYANMVMMDRDLGSRKGNFPFNEFINNTYSTMDAINRQGLLYQWGRKDPFFTSADGTTTEVNIIYDGDGTPITRPNAITCTNAMSGQSNSLWYSIQHPLTFITFGADADWWDNITNNGNSESGGACSWNKLALSQNYAPGQKSLYDPSPEGWKIPMIGATVYSNSTRFSNTIFDGLQIGNGSITDYNDRPLTTMNISGSQYFTYSQYYYTNKFNINAPANDSETRAKNGRLYFLLDNLNETTANIHNSVWFPATCERQNSTGNLAAPTLSHLMFGDMNATKGGVFQTDQAQVLVGVSSRAMGWPVRCIQDNGK